MTPKQIRAIAEKRLNVANPLSWDWPVTGNEEHSMILFSDCSDVKGLCDLRGGKKAREALRRQSDI